MFTSIFNVMQENQVLNLNLMRTGEKLVVCCQPLASGASDAEGSKLTPLVITATPGELDDEFIAAICSPLQERLGMLINLDEFKKSTHKAQPKASAKNEVSVQEGTNTASKKTKKDEQIEEAEKLYKAKNLPGAYAIYKKLYEQDKTNTKIGNRMHEIWAAMSQKPLFEADNETTTVESNPVQSVEIPAGEEVSQIIDTTKTQEPKPVEDMFCQFLNPAKAEEPVAVKEETKASIPPGADTESYQRFLAWQEFQKTQAATQLV